MEVPACGRCRPSRQRPGCQEVAAFPSAKSDALGSSGYSVRGEAGFSLGISIKTLRSETGGRGEHQGHWQATGGIDEAQFGDKAASFGANAEGAGENRRTGPALGKSFPDQG